MVNPKPVNTSTAMVSQFLPDAVTHRFRRFPNRLCHVLILSPYLHRFPI